MASILPPGKIQFCDANGVPLAGGSVAFYVPGTLTPKDTYQDAGQITLNTNPVTLDSAGRALIYGSGTYRQIVKDSSGNTIWDQLTDQPATAVNIQNGSYIWCGTSTGAANTYAITASPAISSYAAGQQFAFFSHQANSGGAVLNVNGIGNKNIYRNAGPGVPVALTGGEIQTSNFVVVGYDGTQFQILSTIANIDIQAYATSSATASAGSVDLSGISASVIDLTAATVGSFSSFGNMQAGVSRTIRFTGATPGTLLAGGSIQLPGSTSIPLSQNDIVSVRSLGGGNWELVSYTAASGALSPASIASAATTLTGANATTAITPAGFAGNKSLTTQGYYKFPGGFTIQWGTLSIGGSSSATFTFPVAFANSVVNVTASPSGTSPDHQLAVASVSVSNTVIANGTASGVTAYVFAIGY